MNRRPACLCLIIWPVWLLLFSRAYADNGGVTAEAGMGCFTQAEAGAHLNTKGKTIPAHGHKLFDNGPLINSPGTGFGGVDESVLQSVSLGLKLLGWKHQTSQGDWIADDFIIPAGQRWTISTITFYAYQTGSPSTSTIAKMNMSLFDVPPDTPGATPIFTESRILSSNWTNIYRASEMTTGTTSERPIMATVLNMGQLELDSGTYWIAWQAEGSGLYPGPWAPPVTINGQPITGNALKYRTSGDYPGWTPASDKSDFSYRQGFPFVIQGHAMLSVPAISDWGIIILLALLATLGLTAILTREGA